MPQSILDQVINSQKMSAISNFDPQEITGKLFDILNERERDIIVKRHGLEGSEKITLEEIGSIYSVTRERVRQVENTSLKKIRDNFNEGLLKELEVLLTSILEDHGHVMSEDRLIQMLLSNENTSDRNVALVRFLLNQLLHERFKVEKESTHIYKAWALQDALWHVYHDAVDAMVKIIEEYGEPMKLEDLIDTAQKKVMLHDDWNDKYEAVLMNYLDVTKKIEENKFNEWGLAHWSTIRPKRMNDKIYLIMKKEGKPLHFTEIAKRINEASFDTRIAYPATIHNELILDGKYVLVGRGIYALKEWGYKPGVVLDVIKNILSESKTPLTRDDIIREVLKNRIVKRSTVVLALMNKKYFEKDSDGNYILVAR